MMKNYFKAAGAILLVLAVTFSACKKDDEDDPKTTRDYLIAGNWKITAGTIDPGIDFGGVVITDLMMLLDDCDKDDLVRFNDNGTITDDEGAVKCDPSDPQTTTEGTWTLSSDNTTLTMTYPDEDPTVMTITSINDNTMVATYTLTEDFGGGPETFTFTITLTNQ